MTQGKEINRVLFYPVVRRKKSHVLESLFSVVFFVIVVVLLGITLLWPKRLRTALDDYECDTCDLQTLLSKGNAYDSTNITVCYGLCVWASVHSKWQLDGVYIPTMTIWSDIVDYVRVAQHQTKRNDFALTMTFSSGSFLKHVYNIYIKDTQLMNPF